MEIELSKTSATTQVYGSEKYPGDGPTVLSDDQRLRRLGKKPLLNRSFGFMSILGFSCSTLITWEAILVVSVQGLLNGGPAGVIWGFFINWIGLLSTFASIAEISSIAPTAGGQYHWVAMLAPRSYKNALSYMTGLLSVVAWQAIAAASGYLISTWLQGIVVLLYPDFEPKPWRTVLIIWAVILFAVTINSTSSRMLAKFEGLILVLHLVGFFCVLIPLVYLGPDDIESTRAVFTTFLNEGGWSTQTLSFLVGLPASAYSLLGADCVVHMSEEIQSAATVVPQALLYSILINGLLGFVMVVVMMIFMGDMMAALAAQQTMFYSALEIFEQGVRSTTGASLMACVVLVLVFACSVGGYATASRMLWSFSRDKGMPFHVHLARLTNKTALPITAVFTTLFVTILLSLLGFGSSIALNDVLNLSIAVLYSTYLLVCALLLWRRLTGGIQRGPGDVTEVELIYWGPWKIPEPWGSINNLFAILYLVFIWFWSFWPMMTPVTPATFNFNILLFVSIVVFSVVWYLWKARHIFKGPIREV